MKSNLLLVFILILIGGLIIGISVVMTHLSPRAILPTSVSQSGVSPEKPSLPITSKSAEELVLILRRTYEKGLTWLIGQQLADGSWPDLEGKPDVAFTALALISIGGGTPDDRTRYQDRVAKGVEYLLAHRQADGSFLDPGKLPALVNYKTPLALLALVTLDEGQYQDPILKARNYLAGVQDQDPEEKGLFGGWSETGKDPTPKPGLTVTNFAIDALRQAGLPQDSETWQRATVFLQRCQDCSEYNDFRVTANSGGFVHSPLESKAGEETLPDGTKILKPYGSMTHAGLMSFLYVFVDKNDPRVQATYRWLRGHYTLEENPGLRTDAEPRLGKQGLFYYYYTFAKALDAYGEKVMVTLPDSLEHPWAEELVRKLSALQQPDGKWINEEPRWWEDHALVVTPYCLIALNICRKWVEH